MVRCLDARGCLYEHLAKVKYQVLKNFMDDHNGLKYYKKYQRMKKNLNNIPLAPTRARNRNGASSKNRSWTPEEDSLLTSLVSSRGINLNWAEINKSFPDKTQAQIIERWNKVLDPNLLKGSWTREEDETIVNYVRTCGTKSWTRLAQLLPGRIGKQCRERWVNHLDPNINRGPWTDEEDNLLIELHEKYGNSWTKISDHIFQRSDNAIKNRWNSTLSKRVMYMKNHNQQFNQFPVVTVNATSPPRSIRIESNQIEVPKPPLDFLQNSNFKDFKLPPLLSPLSGDTKKTTSNVKKQDLYSESPFVLVSPLGSLLNSPSRSKKNEKTPTLKENRNELMNLILQQ